HHIVYHSGAAQCLASNPKFAGTVSAQRPSWVVVGQSSTTHGAEEAFGNVDEWTKRRVTQFHQKDPHIGVARKAFGKHAPSGSGADDDVIRFHRAASLVNALFELFERSIWLALRRQPPSSSR